MTTEILPPISTEEKSVADHIEAQIEICLSALSEAESELTHSYARLGGLLTKVQDQKLWLTWGHKTFGQYLAAIEPRVKKGRSQIYSIISVAEKLLPVIGEENLATMGISKAQELKKVLAAGKTISQSMIDTALNPQVTAAELRASAFEEARIFAPETELEKYFDWGGSYLTADEKAEILRAMDITMKLEEIQDSLPDHIKRKLIFLRWAQEFIGTYEAVVQGENNAV